MTDEMQNEYDFTDGVRGAPRPTRKVPISIRLDPDVLAYFRDRVASSGEGSYQADINAALRRVMEQQQAAGR